VRDGPTIWARRWPGVDVLTDEVPWDPWQIVSRSSVAAPQGGLTSVTQFEAQPTEYEAQRLDDASGRVAPLTRVGARQ
jgi:hypothetical protein